MKRFFALATAAGLFAATSAQADINRPFGSHPMTYAAGSIRPNHLSQSALDAAVSSFYDQWKAEYVTEACGSGRYVVLTHTSAGNLTVSEGHGYGMMLMALMAGHDPDAQTIFDGMYTYFLEHPTPLYDHLMAWNQTTSCSNAVNGDNSATDGDLDIAFALLLADKQWGSCGRIDYAAEAALVLADILDGEVDPTESFTLLGDWVPASGAPYTTSTRSSDFMVGHFASFASVGSAAWTDLRDSLYGIIASLQASHSSGVGLVPDFIVNPATSPAPAPADFLENDTDGMYSYNACRVPWRLATDFVTNGDARAKTALDTLNAWIRTKSGNDPSNIGAGYELDGDAIPGTNYPSMAFRAPFGVGAMVNSINQTWLNDVWDEVAGTPLSAEGYYENSLKLLSMIVMSGNWWAPEKVGAPTCTPVDTDECTNPAYVLDASVNLKRLDRGPAAQQMDLRGTLSFPGGAPTVLDAGAQILVEDVGSGDAAIFDLTEATSSVPGAGDAVCDPRDLWKSSSSKVQYRNKSTALDAPTCTPGSANGLSKIQYKLGSTTDVPFRIRAKRSTIAEPVGPLRVTLVLGDTAAAGDAGNCGVSELLDCSGDSASAYCE